ncbi:MAG: hypothetical protein QOD07_2057, partial [Frankiaceae bacterium]|nr:hypothetical protein [Frankiaceae bacterium]
LLVTAALDGRRLAGEADDAEPLSIGVLFFAVIGEIAALAGLAGGRALIVAEAASLGAALLAMAVIGPVTLRLLPHRTVGRWRRLPYLVSGFVTMSAPLVAAGVYVARLAMG